MDDDLVGSIDPGAFSGMTEKQAKKLKPGIVKDFSREQVRALDPEVIDALPPAVFDSLEDEFSNKQLNDLEALQGEGLPAQGDGENIGGPVI